MNIISKLLFLSVLPVLLAATCKSSNNENTPNMIQKEKTASDDSQSMTGLIVYKTFVNKAGRASDFQEMYFRASVQDYFIKFCESSVSKTELEAHLNNLPESGLLGEKAVTLQAEIKDGEWDICDEDMPMQSRIGKYMVVHKIIK